MQLSTVCLYACVEVSVEYNRSSAWAHYYEVGHRQNTCLKHQRLHTILTWGSIICIKHFYPHVYYDKPHNLRLLNSTRFCFYTLMWSQTETQSSFYQDALCWIHCPCRKHWLCWQLVLAMVRKLLHQLLLQYFLDFCGSFDEHSETLNFIDVIFIDQPSEAIVKI